MKQYLVVEQQSVLADSDYLSTVQEKKIWIQVLSSVSLQFHKVMRVVYEGG